jgi:dienelactone hydrolase
VTSYRVRQRALVALICLLVCVSAGACRPAPADFAVQATAAAPSPTASEATEAPASTPSPPALEPSADPAALLDYDAEAPFDVDQGAGSIQVHDISYPSPMGGSVTAYLVVPPGEGPFAGVVFMHGGPGNRSDFLVEALTLARMGAVSILIDGPLARPESAFPGYSVAAFSPAIERALNAQTVVDLRRAVDVLISRADVDPERLAFIGHSYGATQGAVLAGVEHRIKAYALAAAYPRFMDAMPYELRSDEYARELDPIDPIRHVGQAAPSALLFQYGLRDPSLPQDLALQLVEAASEPKSVQWYNTGHMLTPAMIRDHIVWLGTQIGLDTTSQ